MGIGRKNKKAPPRVPEPLWEKMIDASDGARICCRCFGKGKQTLVLLHGNGEDYTCFAKQLDDFAERFQVVTIDSRGHGRSPYVAPMTLTAMAEDLRCALDALDIPSASVVGFSDGGNVAIHFALRYPQRLERLILAGANLFPLGVIRKERRKTRVSWLRYRLYSCFSEAARQRAEILELMIKQPQLNQTELACILAPTLVLAGQWDLIAEDHTCMIAQSIAGSHLRIIPACGHFMFRDKSQWVNETIIKFLAGQ